MTDNFLYLYIIVLYKKKHRQHTYFENNSDLNQIEKSVSIPMQEILPKVLPFNCLPQFLVTTVLHEKRCCVWSTETYQCTRGKSMESPHCNRKNNVGKVYSTVCVSMSHNSEGS